MKTEQLMIHGLTIELTRKKIKNLHLRVYAPHGQIRMTAPLHVKDKEIYDVIHLRLEWIKTQQQKFANRPVIPHLEYQTGEYHYFQGQRYLLNVIYHPAAPKVQRQDSTIHLYVREGSDAAKRQQVLEAWYRQQLQILIPELITKWQPVIKVNVADWGVKQMKTRWGTCNIRDRRIWLALELAKKPLACLEYVVVHEMTHLLERYHNERFYGFMTTFLADWRNIRLELNQQNVNQQILEE
jgi:predicted metal-dependent hydrolase